MNDHGFYCQCSILKNLVNGIGERFFAILKTLLRSERLQDCDIYSHKMPMCALLTSVKNYNESLEKLQDFFFKTETKTNTWCSRPRPTSWCIVKPLIENKVTWLVLTNHSPISRSAQPSRLHLGYGWGQDGPVRIRCRTKKQCSAKLHSLFTPWSVGLLAK